MSNSSNSILKNKAINGWRLFWLISVPLSLVMIVRMSGVDMSSGSGVSTMIGFSVRFAVPFIFLIVAIRPVHALFPGSLPNWLLQNRKYIGMCFAVAMAWQGLFIFLMSNFYRDYYYDEVYLLRDELEGSVGYIFLAAMVVTSFQFGRRHLNAKQWKLLHRSAVYFLFAYAFSVYWWSLSYYDNPQPIDYVFYWSGFLAFALRIAAWGKKRRMNAQGNDAPFPFRLAGGSIVAFGLFMSASSLQWQKSITGFLTGPQWSANLELWLPFWPFEPFLSLFIIGLGTFLLTTKFQAQRQFS